MAEREAEGLRAVDLVIGVAAVGAGGVVSALSRWPRAMGTLMAFGTAALILTIGRRLTSGWASPRALVAPVRRVLIADDDGVHRRLVESVVRGLGWEADAVSTGRAAVAAVRSRAYDIVLMDCAMPELDGLAATQAIRTWEAEGVRVPIVALTADDDAESRGRCLAVGMDDHVTKPIDPERLRARLRLWVHPVDATSEPIDARVLATLESFAADRDAALVGDLIDAFLRSTAETCAAIQLAIAQRDLEGLRREAHRLKGGAGTVGASRLAAMCGALEVMGRSGHLGDVGPLVGRIEHETRQVAALLAARAVPVRKGRAA